MRPMTRYLIVGGDSLIGARLARMLQGQGEVLATSRRPGRPQQPYLDLASGQTDAACAARADVAIICASITSIQACQADPAGTARINVYETLRLIEALAGSGCFVVFPSSNAVFDGRSPYPAEDSPPSPTTEYGRQKSAVECRIQAREESAQRVALVRLSKVVSAESGMAAEFIQRLRRGSACPAFEDLLLCPASLDYVCAGLAAVAAARKPGIFHLSGAVEMSYARFALHLAGRLGADPSLVRPGSSGAANTGVLFRPAHPALGMRDTRQMLGLSPETLDSLLDALVADAD